jgi:HSP20 family protein
MLWSDLERLGRFLDPWREFERMNRALTRAAVPATVDFPAVNVWTSAEHGVITSELPGVDPNSIELSVAGSTLTLRGARQREDLKEGAAFHRRERWAGTFSKAVELPFPIEGNKVEARYEKGVLYVSLPRAEADKPRKITVKTQ